MVESPLGGEQAFLGSCPLFAGLDDCQLAEVLARGVVQQVARKEWFFREGEPAQALWVLRSGRGKLTKLSPDGQQVILRVLAPGDMFGGVMALGDHLYPATAEALTASSAMAWVRGSLEELFSTLPRLARNALSLLAERMAEMQERYRELATERVTQRVARALVRLVRQAGRRVDEGVLIDLPLSREDLAAMSGTTLFTVSRILSEWESRGLVTTGRQRVLVRFPHGLVSIAEDLDAPGGEEGR